MTHDRPESMPTMPSLDDCCAAVYETVSLADKALKTLQRHGINDKEITVLCSQDTHVKHFAQYDPVTDSGPKIASAAVGGTVGSVLGGVVAASSLATLGGLPIVVAGGMAGMLTGGVVGGLAGAMAQRGVEPDVADFYDQAISHTGYIMIVVEPSFPEEVTTSQRQQRKQEITRILKEAGALPIPSEN